MMDILRSKEQQSTRVRRREAGVRPGHPRQSVQVKLGPDEIWEGPVGTTLETFLRVARPDAEDPVVAALVDGNLRELTTPVVRDAEVRPITLSQSDGMRIYQRSLAFLLVTAARELHPAATITVDHSVAWGGFFCQVEGRSPFNKQELVELEKRMWEIVSADHPIVRLELPRDEALKVFQRQGFDDKIRLLSYRSKPYLTVYRLLDTWDYFYGYMVPSTGYLRWFGLQERPPGFILRFPLRHKPIALPPYQEHAKLTTVFLEHRAWMEALEVECIAALNQAVETGRIREVILVAEALHEQRVADLARRIAADRERIRLVLVAGPSSAGKTAFARRLAVQLLTHGVRPLAIEMDGYFVDREQTPRDEHGEYDFETLEALDRGLLMEQILALLEGKRITIPRYDFTLGKRREGPTVSITPGQVILLEGIHGLNPELLPGFPRERVFRLYVSALTQLKVDHHNRISTTDTRLLRRLVRDAQFRGYSAQETLERWASVRRGEARNIFPYQEEADAMFNSALVYELAVLKPLAEPLLRQVEPGTDEYVEARRLLSFLEWVLPCDGALVPDNSILREFIGGSILHDLTLLP
ncbi:MAG: nucleoside kinase [Anaerolineae bacterium]